MALYDLGTAVSRLLWTELPGLCEHRGPTATCVDCNDESAYEIRYGRSVLGGSSVRATLRREPTLDEVLDRIGAMAANAYADQDARDLIGGW